eukprot:2533505-Rhodomonas_salina.1
MTLPPSQRQALVALNGRASCTPTLPSANPQWLFLPCQREISKVNGAATGVWTVFNVGVALELLWGMPGDLVARLEAAVARDVIGGILVLHFLRQER